MKLVITALDQKVRTFGESPVKYAVFHAKTPTGDTVPVAITHNALTNADAKIDMLSTLVGSTITTKEAASLRDPDVLENPDDRINAVINKQPIDGRVPSLVTLNRSNCNVELSEAALDTVKDMAASIEAKARIEEEKAERAYKLQQAARRLAEKTIVMGSSANLGD